MNDTIFILNCDEFIPANICNYIIQHTKYNVVGFTSGRSSTGKATNLPHLMPSLQSKTRFTPQIWNMNFDFPTLATAVDFYKPSHIIASKSKLLDDYMYLFANEFKDSNLIYIRSGEPDNYVVENVSMLSVPHAFGLRQPINQSLGRVFWSLSGWAEPAESQFSDAKKEWIYIKDVFNIVSNHLDGFNSFSKPHGKFEYRTNYINSEQEIFNHLSAVVEGRESSLNTQMALGKNWIPKYAFGDALEHTLVWYRANRWAELI